jgi:hypothetical protein
MIGVGAHRCRAVDRIPARSTAEAFIRVPWSSVLRENSRDDDEKHSAGLHRPAKKAMMAIPRVVGAIVRDDFTGRFFRRS